MDFKSLGENIRESYRNVAQQYRRDDEIEITTELHRHLKGILESLTSSFGRPISVLDLGCGTGRYFHCLRNVRHLVGLDVSEEMLRIAAEPVRAEEVTIETIELLCQNAFMAKFPPGTFDVIYSLGMFGNGCPVTVDICNRFHDWLAPGGQLFFNALSIETIPFSRRLRRSVRNGLYPWLPGKIKRVLDAREAPVPFFGLGKRKLHSILRTSRFSEFSIASYPSDSQLWRGVHLECRAMKP